MKSSFYFFTYSPKLSGICSSVQRHFASPGCRRLPAFRATSRPHTYMCFQRGTPDRREVFFSLSKMWKSEGPESGQDGGWTSTSTEGALPSSSMTLIPPSAKSRHYCRTSCYVSHLQLTRRRCACGCLWVPSFVPKRIGKQCLHLRISSRLVAFCSSFCTGAAFPELVTMAAV